MKLTKSTIEGIKKSAISESEKAYKTMERQQGAVNLCDWILKNCEFENEEAVKGDENGGTENKA